MYVYTYIYIYIHIYIYIYIHTCEAAYTSFLGFTTKMMNSDPEVAQASLAVPARVTSYPCRCMICTM